VQGAVELAPLHEAAQAPVGPAATPGWGAQWRRPFPSGGEGIRRERRTVSHGGEAVVHAELTPAARWGRKERRGCLCGERNKENRERT
jgi:hypothetical protein